MPAPIVRTRDVLVLRRTVDGVADQAGPGLLRAEYPLAAPRSSRAMAVRASTASVTARPTSEPSLASCRDPGAPLHAHCRGPPRSRARPALALVAFAGRLGIVTLDVPASDGLPARNAFSRSEQ